MRIKHILLSLVALLSISAAASAGDYLHSTPAIQGYDVVSYHTGKRPVRGNGNFVVEHAGATYLFSGKASQELFQENPEKYVPAFGGYCAFGVSVGKKFVGDPEVWRVVDGRLYLNLDTGIQHEWLKDVPGRIRMANSQWKKIRGKSPASL